MKEELIAPCGMNCGICSSYLAFKNDIRSRGIKMPYCAGCRPRDKQCAFLKKKCNRLLEGQVEYCYQCDDFPCANLLKVDTKYRANFRMSMVENLEYIRENGVGRFLEREEAKWRCPQCGAVVCCHNGVCFSCGLDLLKNKKKLYQWEDI